MSVAKETTEHSPVVTWIMVIVCWISYINRSNSEESDKIVTWLSNPGTKVVHYRHR